MAEGAVGVFNLGTEPVRVLKITTLDANGNPVTVDMQVVTIANTDGSPLETGVDKAILEELQAIRALLEMAISH